MTSERKLTYWRCTACGVEGFDEQSKAVHVRAYSNSPLKAKIEEEYMDNERKAERYIYCSIKNIAVPNKLEITKAEYEHIHLYSSLPNNCIRIRDGVFEWCMVYCRECLVDE